MKLLAKYSGSLVDCEGPSAREDEAVVGLQASLRSSASLKAILEGARSRCRDKNIGAGQMKRIEGIYARYEQHQKAVRDHCLDYFNSVPSTRLAGGMHRRTGELVAQGKILFAELREAILTF
jgi:hypothetical protein